MFLAAEPGEDGERGPPGVPGVVTLGANPTASLGLAAVNGSALTFMRSDGAPALDQTIAPTWTALHAYTISGTAIAVRPATSVDPAIEMYRAANGAGIGIGRTLFYGQNSTPAKTLYGLIQFAIVTNTAGGEYGEFYVQPIIAGAAANRLVIGSKSAVGDVASAAKDSTFEVVRGTAYRARFDFNSSGDTYIDGNTFNIRTAAGAPLITISAAGLVRFNVYGAGVINSDASGNLTAVSDRRVKKNIRPWRAGLDQVLKLRPVLHGYRKDSGLDQTKNNYAGFIAQDVKRVLPEAVGQMSDGMLTLSDRPIIAALVNAVQTLAARIDALESK